MANNNNPPAQKSVMEMTDAEVDAEFERLVKEDKEQERYVEPEFDEELMKKLIELHKAFARMEEEDEDINLSEEEEEDEDINLSEEEEE